MSPLAQALHYARRGWRILPLRLVGGSKVPLIRRWPELATADQEQISRWWTDWPDAVIGAATGQPFVVLDVDRKNGVDGFETLDALGISTLPDTPIAHSPNHGVHLYFRPPAGRILRNTTGAQGMGVGLGLDWRGEGGFITLPTPGTGYRWDPLLNFDTCEPADPPRAALPRPPEPRQAVAPVQPCRGLSPYGEAALDSAARRILAAPRGQQEATLNSEAFAIGRLAGAGAVPAGFARDVLHWAASQMHDFDFSRPWAVRELTEKINRSFAQGMARPRPHVGGNRRYA